MNAAFPVENTMKAFTNRYELKYLIPWSTYIQIRKELVHVFKCDPSAGSSGSYDVISLYYDTPALDFFWQKIDGEEERVKLRLRTYVHDSSHKKQPVFLEIKRKKNQNIFKKRILLKTESTDHFFEQPWNNAYTKESTALAEETQKEMESLGTLLHLQPTLLISYKREPFVNRDNLNSRVTFDTNIRYRSANFSLTKNPMDKHVLSPSHVIMEIKYTDYFPRWLLSLLHKYNCEARTFSKYCIGIEHFIKEQPTHSIPTGGKIGLVH